MKRGDIISYSDIISEEGFILQRGMNFNIGDKDYGIILMSVRSNAPYADRFENNNTTIIYEGHNIPKNYAPNGKNVETVDQQMKTPSGKLTENGLFYDSAEQAKKGNPAKRIKVYEKIKDGIWVYNGFFKLTNAWKEVSGQRKVFKFKLEMINEPEQNRQSHCLTSSELEHNRLIQSSPELCVICFR